MSEVAPAPAAATAPSAAPANGTPAQPKPPEVDELGAVLKKGALKVKASGKEHVIDSPEKLRRYVEQGLSVSGSLEALAKERESVAPLAQLRDKLKAAQESGDDEAVASVLEEMLDGGMLDKVSERRLRKLYEREKSMEGLSEREKAMASELEKARAEKQKLESERKQREEQQKQQQEQQQVEAIKQHMGSAIVGTLKALDLPEKLEPLAVNFMKPIMAAALRAGVPLDPSVLAEKVRPMLDDIFTWQMSGLDGEKLLTKLGPDIQKKFRAALLAKLNGTPAPVAPAAGGQEQQSQRVAPWDPRKRW